MSTVLRLRNPDIGWHTALSHNFMFCFFVANLGYLCFFLLDLLSTSPYLALLNLFDCFSTFRLRSSVKSVCFSKNSLPSLPVKVGSVSVLTFWFHMNDFWSSAFAWVVLMFFSQPLSLKAIKCESYTVVSHLFQPSKSRQAEGESGRNIHHDLFSSRRPGSNSWINSTHWVLIKPAHVHSYETRGFFQK